MRRFGTAFTLLLAFIAFGQCRLGAEECRGSIHGTLIGQDGQPWSDIGLVLEPVGDYDYVLPRTKTDERGQYRFSDVCIGFWGVFVQDEKNGYPFAGRLMNFFLYGVHPPQIAITEGHWDAELDVKAPPKPGLLFVQVRSAETKSSIPVVIELKVSRKRQLEYSCQESSSLPCAQIQVPPNTKVKVQIISTGFRTVNWDHAFYVSPGETTKIDVQSAK